MVFTIEVAVILALLIGAAGGFISSIASWLSTTDPFSTRKNIKGILTGIFAGLALGVVAIGTLTAEMPFTSTVVTLVTIFLSAVGIDQLTSKVSGMVSTRAIDTIQNNSFKAK